MTRDDKAQTFDTETTGNTETAMPATAARLMTLVLLTALSVLPVNMILPSLPNVAAAFQADLAIINLSVTGYAIVSATTNIFAGALSDRYGRRPVILVAVSAFIAASIGCALAGNIGIFLFFRALQASIAPCFSIALVIIKETSGERRAASRFGYLAMGWAIAPMLGPLFGGLLDELFGWRASFLTLAAMGAAALALSLREIKDTGTHAPRPKRNYLASYGQLLASPRFWAHTLCMAFSMGALYIFLGGAPLIVGQLLGGSSAKLGLCMGMVPAGFILGSYLAGRYASRQPLGAILVFARLLTCTGLLLGLILSLSGFTHILAFFGPCMFIGIGNGLTMPAANSGVLSVRADLAGTAAGLAAAMTTAGGAVIGSVAGLFLTEAASIHALFEAMLAAASLALILALYAAWLERRVYKAA